MAALATAIGIALIKSVLKGVGIIYSGPKVKSWSGNSSFIAYDTGYLAKSAMALAAAIFISSFIWLALVSKAALKR